MVAWAKQDPVRIDLDIPDNVKKQFPAYAAVFKRYGHVIYGFYVPDENKSATEEAWKAFLDLNFEERGAQPLAAFKNESERIRTEYFSYLLPDITLSH